MIDLNQCNEWQHRDPDTGLVMPWYTRPALDEIKKWVKRDKTVFEIGGGASTLWWQNEAALVFTLESSLEYIKAINRVRDYPDVHDVMAYSLTFLNEIANELFNTFNIVIVDGEDRDDCIPAALALLKPGGRLIIDNWLQPSVHVHSKGIKGLIEDATSSCVVYKQPGHPDWQTAIFNKK